MKPLLLLLYVGLCTTTFSCKKFIDKQKEDYILGIMTDGRWYLENYTEYGADNTADFNGYEFQFYDNNRLDAINTNDNAASTGTWAGDVTNIAMTVNFPSGTDNLKRLNHTWKITDSYTNLVFGETTTPQGTITIRLKKK